MPQAMKTLRKPGFDVELAVSPLAGMKGAAGYHTSVLVAGAEYFFSPLGIVHSPVITSHKSNPEMKLFHMGLSKYSGMDLMEFLDQYFPLGHYDLLRCNCNSFSDCALYFLCEQRLDLKYRSLEALGKIGDDYAGIIQKISAGEYVPNPRSVDFSVDDVISDIKAEREVREITRGDIDSQCLGGANNIFAQDDFVTRWQPYDKGCEYGAEDSPPRCWRPTESPCDCPGDDYSPVQARSCAASVEEEQAAEFDLEQRNPFTTQLPEWAAKGADQGLIGGA